ncbi:hypothetical protein [Paenibacillus sp. LBL]|uniref:hypothetical protein n=1 Tax=Paenibacillus sp. LBL TaxID=2940563 RepID=UPI002475F3EB|nr:hypothetical protein [Paenibacillus sp. LBL]
MKNRFWEYYLIRYLAGTIFGVIILFYLFYNYHDYIGNSFQFKSKDGEEIHQEVYSLLFNTTFEFEGVSPDKVRLDNREVVVETSKENSSLARVAEITVNEVTVLSMVILLVAGFLYMYISSMFVLFLHTFRFIIFGLIKGGRKSRLYVFYLILSRVRAVGKQSIKEETNKNNKEDNSKEPSKKERWVNEYVESYRHLREHGNAFGILLSEMLFAYFLIKTDFKIYGLALWILIGFLSWWVATYMEVKLQKNHEHRFRKEN